MKFIIQSLSGTNKNKLALYFGTLQPAAKIKNIQFHCSIFYIWHKLHDNDQRLWFLLPVMHHDNFLAISLMIFIVTNIPHQIGFSLDYLATETFNLARRAATRGLKMERTNCCRNRVLVLTDFSQLVGNVCTRKSLHGEESTFFGRANWSPPLYLDVDLYSFIQLHLELNSSLSNIPYYKKRCC